MEEFYKVDKKSARVVDPRIKDALRLVALGSIVAASLVMPGAPLLIKPIMDQKRKEDELERWKFNPWRLRQLLKRLQDQKMIELIQTPSGFTVKVTDKGKRRLLKYNLDDLMLTDKKWDHKWRIIAYDIDESKKAFRRSFQIVLRKLKFLQLQKSVYLTPFPCENEIEYLRQIHNVGREVAILTVSGLENEQAYKEFFGLK
jgi:hypothetical protein